nr:Manganese transport system membrane protein mntB [Klebsiella pneumoniae]
MIWHTFFQPFIEFGFMRRALVVCLALSLSTTMLGVFLLLRRMSLMGDALSHAILPGVAVGYLLSGMSLLAMTLGGFIAGIVVAPVAGWVSRRTPLKEDASFAGFYLGSLALGVTGVAARLQRGPPASAVWLHSGGRPRCGAVCQRRRQPDAIVHCAVLPRSGLRGVRQRPAAGESPAAACAAAWAFLALLVLNLVAGFQVLGTLMAVG